MVTNQFQQRGQGGKRVRREAGGPSLLVMEKKAYLIGFFLSRSSWAMKQHVNRLLKEAGMGEISMGFIGVLLDLYRADGQTITELGERVNLEKSTMTGLIDRMARAGLVTRESDPADRRVLRIWLTERGKKVQTGVAKVLAKSYQDLTRGIAEKDVERVEKVLAHIIENTKG